MWVESLWSTARKVWSNKDNNHRYMQRCRVFSPRHWAHRLLHGQTDAQQEATQGRVLARKQPAAQSGSVILFC